MSAPRRGDGGAEDAAGGDEEARAAALIDALYAGARGARGEADLLAGYERVRGMFRELPTEDAPPAVSARLLAAAAARRGGVPGWWTRLAAWFQGHGTPVLAVASLALVVGVAGVLVARGQLEVAHPEAPRRDEPAAATASDTSTTAPETRGAPGAAEPTQGGFVDGAPGRAGGGAPSRGADGESAPGAKAAGGADKRPGDARSPATKEIATPAPRRSSGALDEEAAGAPAPKKSTSIGDEADRPAAESRRSRAPEEGSHAQAAAPAKTKGSAPSPAAAPADDAEAESVAAPRTDEEARGSEATGVARAARAAAAAGDCAKARSLLARLRGLDPARATAAVRDDRALAACAAAAK